MATVHLVRHFTHLCTHTQLVRSVGRETSLWGLKRVLVVWLGATKQTLLEVSLGAQVQTAAYLATNPLFALLGVEKVVVGNIMLITIKKEEAGGLLIMFWFVVVWILRCDATFRPQIKIIRIFESLRGDLIFGLCWNFCGRDSSLRLFSLVCLEKGLNLGSLFFEIKLGPLFFLFGVLTKILYYFLVVNHLICCISLLERNLKLRRSRKRSLATHSSIQTPSCFALSLLCFWRSKWGELILVKRLGGGGGLRSGVFVSTAYRLRRVLRLATRSV